MMNAAFKAAVTALLMVRRVATQSATTDNSTALSCVQVSMVDLSSCPCDASTFTFSMAGETSVAANTVNLAVVLDASGSINGRSGVDEWDLENEFAKNTVAAFASRNLFENGGTASYIQFSDEAISSEPFSSKANFDAYVDSSRQVDGDTNIVAGIAAGRELLKASSSTAKFMIVVTDGDVSEWFDEPYDEAEAARDDNITVFAVGVGDGVGEQTLLDIAGDPSQKFQINKFDEFNDALEDILTASGGSAVPCLATGVTVTVEFAASVTSVNAYPGASISGINTVTFPVENLGTNSTDFSVVLDTCSVPVDTSLIAAPVLYADDQMNEPDFSQVDGTQLELDCSSGPTPAPAMPNGGTGRPTSPPVGLPEDGDCSACSNLTKAQEEALASYDNGGKRIVCDRTCMDGVSDPSHCNYFGLGQICRGCGDCSVCTPCP